MALNLELIIPFMAENIAIDSWGDLRLGRTRVELRIMALYDLLSHDLWNWEKVLDLFLIQLKLLWLTSTPSYTLSITSTMEGDQVPISKRP